MFTNNQLMNIDSKVTIDTRTRPSAQSATEASSGQDSSIVCAVNV